MGSVYFQEPSTDGAPGIWELEDALRYQVSGQWPWTVLLVFGSGEQGGLYDPSDLSTLFRDAEGTLPVTAAGQPVGRVLDKSGHGNHLQQETAAARPTLGRMPATGRRNLLTYSSSPAQVASSGTSSREGFTFAGNLVTPTSGTSRKSFRLNTVAYNTDNVISFRVRSQGVRYLNISWSSATRNAAFDIVDGLVLQPTVPDSGEGRIESEGDGVFLISFTRAVVTTGDFFLNVVDGFSREAVAYQATCDGVAGFELLGAQLELGSEVTPYQKVGSAFDVTEAGVPDLYYLWFDGVDDVLKSVSATSGWGPDATVALAFQAEVAASGTDTIGVWGVSATGNLFPANNVLCLSFRLRPNLSGAGGFGARGNTNPVCNLNISQGMGLFDKSQRQATIGVLRGSSGWRWFTDGAQIAQGTNLFEHTLPESYIQLDGSKQVLRFFGGLLIQKAVSDPEVSDLSLWMAEKAGVTL